MKNYIGIDGLVLCVIGGKKDIERWISSIDMLDHSIINYEELLGSVNNLLKGGLVYIKKEKFVLSKLAKRLLRGGFWLPCVTWQLKVQKRIREHCYDEEKEDLFFFTKEEYDAALQRYLDRMEKMIGGTLFK